MVPKNGMDTKTAPKKITAKNKKPVDHETPHKTSKAPQDA